MHIMDGVLSPLVAQTTAVLSIGTVVYSGSRLKADDVPTRVPRIAMTAAVIFAGQMVNFPLPGVPASGHLMGGVLAGVLLGPFGGFLAIAAVLITQCLLFADGGLLALGANILNMGIIGCLGGTALYRLLLGTGRRRAADHTPEPSRRRVFIAAGVAAWLSVIASAFVFCIEFALSHALEANVVGSLFLLMIAFHAAIGIGEAVITVLLLRFLMEHRPGIVATPERSPSLLGRVGGRVMAGTVLAFAIAAFFAPWASSHPDGLETVLARLGVDDLSRDNTTSLLDDYSVFDAEGIRFGESLSTALAGIGGVLVLLAIGWLLTLVLPASPPRSEPQ